MDKEKPTELREQKMGKYVGVQLGAMKFRNKPDKLTEYIRLNRQYFPNIREEWLVDLEKKYKKK